MPLYDIMITRRRTTSEQATITIDADDQFAALSSVRGRERTGTLGQDWVEADSSGVTRSTYEWTVRVPKGEENEGELLLIEYTGEADASPSVSALTLPENFEFQVSRRPDGWWRVTCADYPGLYVMHRDLAAVLSNAPLALANLLLANTRSAGLCSP